MFLTFFLTSRRTKIPLGIITLFTLILCTTSITHSQHVNYLEKIVYQETEERLVLGAMFEAVTCFVKDIRDADCILNATSKIPKESLQLLNVAIKEKHDFLVGHANNYKQNIDIEEPLQRELIARHLEIEENEVLTVGHLLEIEEIELESQEELDSFFVNLSPEWFANLQRLDLNRTSVSDISSLSGLVNLERLFLNNTQVSDISSLSGLTNLEKLLLSYTQVSDISSLSALTNLKELSLYNTQVSDISSLSGLTNLQELYLYNTQVSDISSLSALTNLEWLFLYNTQVSDISSLSGLTNLEWLVLENTQVSDISSLSGLTNLEWLVLENTQVSDISSLSGLTNLQYLYLENTQVSDVSSLSDLTKLRIHGK